MKTQHGKTAWKTGWINILWKVSWESFVEKFAEMFCGKVLWKSSVEKFVEMFCGKVRGDVLRLRIGLIIYLTYLVTHQMRIFNGSVLWLCFRLIIHDCAPNENILWKGFMIVPRINNSWLCTRFINNLSYLVCNKTKIVWMILWKNLCLYSMNLTWLHKTYSCWNTI